MNPAGESFLFDQKLRLRSEANNNTMNLTSEPQRNRRIWEQFTKFFRTVNHLRRIRIEVTFDYQEVQPEVATAES